MLSLIALALTAVASGSAPNVTDTNPIVVEGTKNREQAIHDFVSAVTPAHPGGQLSRFANEVCPAAAGLSEAQNAQVAERMRAVASAAGLKLAPKGCGPNALVVVVKEKNEFIAALRKRYPIYFQADPLGNSVRIVNEPGAATAWHIRGLMTADHLAAGIHFPGSGDGGGSYYVTSSVDASRLRPPEIPHFLGGVVVVNVKSLTGLTTMQLADYAAMRLYAATDPARLKPSASTILSALDAPLGTPVPLSLTSWDLNFLKGLYSMDDRQFAARQRSEIEHIVRKQAQ